MPAQRNLTPPAPGATVIDPTGAAWELASYENDSHSVVLVCTQPDHVLTGEDRTHPYPDFHRLFNWGGKRPGTSPDDYRWPWLVSDAPRSKRIGRPDLASRVDWEDVLTRAQTEAVLLKPAPADEPDAGDFTMSTNSMRVRVYREARDRGYQVMVQPQEDGSIVVAPPSTLRRTPSRREMAGRKLKLHCPALQPHEINAVLDWAEQLAAAHNPPANEDSRA